MEDGMTKSYIWPFVNRFAHILLMLFFAASYILGDFDKLLSYHVAFGLALGVVFLFRTIWGFIGPKYSRFSDFNFSINDLKSYLLTPFSKTKEYIGHNPASSYAIVFMIIVAFLTIITGLLAYGIQENHGIFSYLHNSFFREMEFFKEIHEFLSNLFLAIVGVHMAGAMIDKVIKKGDSIDSMVDGYKKSTKEVSIKLNIFQKAFSLLWIIVSLFSIFYFIFTNNIFIANANVKQNYTALHADFVDECASCHMLYPPNLLPKDSWVKMMKDLENHFGDDASIDELTNISISNFLKQNSAENSTHQASLGILNSLKDNNSTIIAISKTPYWVKRHKEIDKNIFKQKNIRSRANCKACHTDIEYGLLENDLIKIPKG